MIFHPTEVEGAWLIEAEKHVDERGFFARSFCAEEFAARGLDPHVAQCNISRNRRRHTLRGMHAQAPPHAETKLVRCTRGRLWDVILDLRPGSPTFLRHHGVELSAEGTLLLYVPRGCYHGFLTLEDDTEIFYQISHPSVPEAGRGVRWNDPAFGIRWPAEPAVLNPRDAAYPDWSPPEESR